MELTPHPEQSSVPDLLNRLDEIAPRRVAGRKVNWAAPEANKYGFYKTFREGLPDVL